MTGNGDAAGFGSIAEQIDALAGNVETMARQAREVDDEPKFHSVTLDLGVSEPQTFGDLLDIVALALRGIHRDLSGGDAR